jgi:RHS repeat-associated protein
MTREVGLDYFGARYYSRAQGRFTSPDAPLIDQLAAAPQSWNLYAYAGNNPLTNYDPNGRWCLFGKFGDTCWHKDAEAPKPPKPPAVITSGTPQYALATAQGSARQNPAFAPTGMPGTYDRVTHCNEATCRIVKDVGGSTNGLVDQSGHPNLANTDARTLATSPDWRRATPQEAMQAANQGVLALGVKRDDPHGHILTASPELMPGLRRRTAAEAAQLVAEYEASQLSKRESVSPTRVEAWSCRSRNAKTHWRRRRRSRPPGTGRARASLVRAVRRLPARASRCASPRQSPCSPARRGQTS